MQVPNEAKRERILAAAADLFSTRPFHKVLLSDVAAQASVGKGTLYVYFANKEELYVGVLCAGFAELVAKLEACPHTGTKTAAEALTVVVRELVNFAYRHSAQFELMRSLSLQQLERGGWPEQRRAMVQLIATVIRRGVDRGEFAVEDPDLAAAFVPGLVRSALLAGPGAYPQDKVQRQITSFLLAALRQPAGV